MKWNLEFVDLDFIFLEDDLEWHFSEMVSILLHKLILIQLIVIVPELK